MAQDRKKDDKPQKSAPEGKLAERRDRQAQALRENLQRRKQQRRGRDDEPARSESAAGPADRQPAD